MRDPVLRVRWLVLVCLVCAGLTSQQAIAQRSESVTVESDPWSHTMEYTLVVPTEFDPARAYPVLVLFPPGKQDRAMAEAAVGSYVRDESSRRGWVVVLPIAAEGTTWNEATWSSLDRLLLDVAGRVRTEGGRFHFGGVSSGGRSALRHAIALPHRCAGVVTLPGYIDQDVAIGVPPGMPLYTFVGEKDDAWRPRVNATATAWRDAGGEATVEIVSGQEHILKTLSPRRIFEVLEKHRARAGDSADRAIGNGEPGAERGSVRAGRLGVEANVWKLLDGLHAAASNADADAYFGCFAAEAVFLGTDPKERWTVEEFKMYSKASFERKRGWRFEVERRVVVPGPGHAVAWFDETLRHEQLGDLRGTGVAIMEGGKWKVAQYSLSVPIPNEELEHLPAMIRR